MYFKAEKSAVMLKNIYAKKRVLVKIANTLFLAYYRIIFRVNVPTNKVIIKIPKKASIPVA